MARLTGIDTVHDFRTADVAAGGQGAPLAPIYHVALLRAAAPGQPGALLNLGGVGNITSWDGDFRDRAHFDTGPGNAPLNDWIRRHGAGGMDRDGAIAAAGRVDEARLARLLSHPWLDRPFPKSLDRDDFTAAMADGLSLEDGAATLTAFTAGCVARALALLSSQPTRPRRPARLVVCGGGRRNPTLMRALAERTGIAIESAEQRGWRGDAIEAECFAYLALRRRRGLPISFPATTGVPAPMAGGVLNPGLSRLCNRPRQRTTLPMRRSGERGCGARSPDYAHWSALPGFPWPPGRRTPPPEPYSYKTPSPTTITSFQSLFDMCTSGSNDTMARSEHAVCVGYFTGIIDLYISEDDAARNGRSACRPIRR